MVTTQDNIKEIDVTGWAIGDTWHHLLDTTPPFWVRVSRARHKVNTEVDKKQFLRGLFLALELTTED